MAQALAPGSEPPMQCHLGPQETCTTARRSLQAGRRVSKAQQAISLPSTQTSRGVHPEKEEKKFQWRSESVGKKNFQKGVHSGEKDTGLNVTRPGVAGAACQQLSLGPRLCRPSNDNKTFGREPGDRFAPGPDQKPGTPGHIPPLSGRENSSLPPEAPFLVLGKPSGR
ncbi:uncharacterized protein LOC130861412 isoform X3 [Hippopotamus amphibius kiboko]|uniref:uncharacterized protein LOC130861412 isoform X3 n=1 Tax=Hippopotamus amphibius kiboko TaxID=575201 RepID=UPI002595E450|nr:uncharacterized protein LOC130861412 isoform X3 [Hippopotamus amphibius kiboko]